MNNENLKTCCPKFDPAPWDDKIFEWNNRKFIKDKVFTLFYMPINFGRVISRLMKSVDAAQAQIPEYLCLSDHTSKWNMDIYVGTDREVSGLENVTLSGRFFSKVYEGSFKETGKWCKDFADYTKSKGLNISKMYMWYTTCPKCAKTYGKNYVVIVGRIE